MGPPEPTARLEQLDTYFEVPEGRLEASRVP